MNQQSEIPDKLFQKFQQIYSLPPNDLHNEFLTSWYKFLTAPLKRIPFLYIIPLSILIAVLLYLTVGQLLIRLVSLLQHGF
ncbi:hypothetical protein IPM65_01055 [Candidatus Roizmanbacteria bacterium]|nr:MAG: hypothetical protein IPM65_01055 [Candidatus Roizmanbacteria bacterium]